MSPSRKLLQVALLLGAALVLSQAPLRGDELDRRKLFSKCVKGCAGVMTPGGPASGWVVNVEKRWVLTCQHVVGSRDEVEVVFPTWKEGRLIQDRQYYVSGAVRYKGKVVSADSKRDLAIIQLSSLPAGIEALVIAKESGFPGDNLNMIGNPAASGAMWNYATGTLRAVYQKKFTYKDTQHEVDAMIGETQLPGNPGDSGSAVFNDKGEVLGVHSGGTPDKIQLMATYIDISEVRAFLNQPLAVLPKTKPSTFKDWFDAGVLHAEKRDWDKAIEAYTEAIKISPNDSEAYRRRASAYIGKMMYDKANEDCNAALKLNRDNAYAYNERGVCFSVKGDFKAALEDYNEALRLKPAEPIFLSGRAFVYNALKEFDKALGDADAAIKISPNDAFSWNERGLAYFWKKQYDKALADFTQALKIDPNMMNAYYNRGVVKSLEKNYKGSIDDFNEAIRVNSKYSFAHLERGKSYHFLTQYDKAIKDYTAAIALDPKSAQAYLYRSWCHKALGNQAAADADYRQAEQIDPGLVKMKL
jgi:tetratricopeptide (TPR) repeat protein